MYLFKRAQNATPSRRVLRKLVTLLAVLTVGIQALPSSASAVDRSVVSGCSYETSRVLGYLWADSTYRDDPGKAPFFRYRARTNSSISEHMTRNLNELGLTYTVEPNGEGRDIFKVYIDNLDGDLLLINPAWNRHTKCDKPAFLASVIESEGSAAGLVLDDPKAERRRGIRRLLRQPEIGIRTSQWRQNVFAAEADWSKFGTVPFVACGRVPGGNANCDLTIAPTD